MDLVVRDHGVIKVVVSARFHRRPDRRSARRVRRSSTNVVFFTASSKMAVASRKLRRGPVIDAKRKILWLEVRVAPLICGHVPWS